MTFVLPISVYEDPAYNKLRRGYLLLVGSLLDQFVMEINDYVDMIIAIEKSCYDHAIEIADYELLTASFAVPAFEHLYRTRIMRITKNLDIESEVGDEYLGTGLVSGAIDPTTVSKLENVELAPSKSEHIMAELNARLNQTVSTKTSSLYRCRKCGKKETTIRTVQMRSLDEPSTNIISCVFCGYKWFN